MKFLSKSDCLELVNHLSENLVITELRAYDGSQPKDAKNWYGSFIITENASSASEPKGPYLGFNDINYRTGDEHELLYTTEAPAYVKYSFRRGFPSQMHYTN